MNNFIVDKLSKESERTIPYNVQRRMNTIISSIFSGFRKKDAFIMRLKDWTTWIVYEYVDGKKRILDYNTYVDAGGDAEVFFAQKNPPLPQPQTPYFQRYDEKEGVRIISLPWLEYHINRWIETELNTREIYNDAIKGINEYSPRSRDDQVFYDAVSDLKSKQHLEENNIWWRNLQNVSQYTLIDDVFDILKNQDKPFRFPHFFAYRIVGNSVLDLSILFYVATTDVPKVHIKFITRYMQTIKHFILENQDLQTYFKFPSSDDLFNSVLRFCKEEYAVQELEIQHISKGTTDLLTRHLRTSKKKKFVQEDRLNTYKLDLFKIDGSICSNPICAEIATHKWAHTDAYVFCGEECAKHVFDNIKSETF